MEIETKSLKRADVVKVSGRVDSSTAPDLEKVLKGLMEQGNFRIVVDMSDLKFISSAGLRVLISTRLMQSGISSSDPQSAISRWPSSPTLMKGEQEAADCGWVIVSA